MTPGSATVDFAGFSLHKALAETQLLKKTSLSADLRASVRDQAIDLSALAGFEDSCFYNTKKPKKSSLISYFLF